MSRQTKRLAVLGFGIAILPDGSLVSVGNFNETATFGEGEVNETTLVSAGSFDVFVARYSAVGAPLPAELD